VSVWVVIKDFLPDQTGIVFVILVTKRRIGDLSKSRVKFVRWNRVKITNGLHCKPITSGML